MKSIKTSFSGVLIFSGWVAVIHYFLFGYLDDVMALGYWYGRLKEIGGTVLPILLLIYIIIAFRQHKEAITDQVNRMVLIVWLLLLFALILTNLILYQLNNQVDYELQQPIFMILTSLAIFATGRLKNWGIMTIGAIIFFMLGIWAFTVDLSTQKLLHAIGWFVGFVIPGHMLAKNEE